MLCTFKSCFARYNSLSLTTILLFSDEVGRGSGAGLGGLKTFMLLLKQVRTDRLLMLSY